MQHAGIREPLIGVAIVVLIWTFGATGPASAQTMDIYWVDVEGGGATLIVGPTGESMLVDTGWPRPEGRDAERIVAAMQDAGLEKLDYMLITHFHTDHVGSLGELAAMVPMERFLDHGGETEERNQQWRDIYLEVAGDARMVANAGDVMSLGDVEVRMISSNMGAHLRDARRRRAQPALRGSREPAARLGREPADPGGAVQLRRFLVPEPGRSRLGHGDEAVVPGQPAGDGHALPDQPSRRLRRGRGSGAPARHRPAGGGVQQRPRKGITAPHMYDRVAEMPGVEGIWQGHLALTAEGHNTADDMIANFGESEECEGHWLKASVQADGTFTMTNGRNGYSRTYTVR